MGRQNDGMAVAVEAPHELPQPLPQFDVDARGRLVEHDDRGLVYQGLRHQHAALHPARQRAHVDVGLRREVEVVHHLVDPAVVAADAEIPGLQAQRLAHGEERVEHQFLRHHPEQPARAAVVPGDVRAENAYRAGIGPCQARDHIDQRGLARAVGAEQAEELALLDREAHSGERAQPAIALLELQYFYGFQCGAAASGATGSRPSTP